MTPEQLNTIRRLKSMPVLLKFEPSNIDAENGIIRDVVMVEEGEAKGHGVHLESEFVTNLVAFDQANFSDRGVKVRLGHPGLSDDPQGTQLGFMKNVRKRKSEEGKMQGIADLHLLDSADDSPSKPGMKSWVLKMAKEAPDFIMSSIVFKPSGYYQRKPNGHKHRLEYDYKTETWNIVEEWGKIFAEFDEESGASHYYTDLVEAGAATDQLFSNQANPHLFVAQFGTWLDDHPEIRNFIQQHPDKVQAFLDRAGFKSKTPKKTTMKGLKELLFGKDQPNDDTVISPEDIQALREKIQEADTALADANTKLTELSQEVAQLKTSLSDTENERDSLKEKVTQLEAQAADVQTRLAKEADAGGEEQSWMKDPVNQKAAKAYKRHKAA